MPTGAGSAIAAKSAIAETEIIDTRWLSLYEEYLRTHAVEY